MASTAKIRHRTLTVVAAGFLAFDGACLIAGGLYLHRVLVAIAGACLVASSGLVFVYWRWHRRQVDEIAAARRALGEQRRALRDLMQRN